MRALHLRHALAVLAIAAGTMAAVVNQASSKALNCAAPSWPHPTPITCGKGFSTFRLESESATPIYIGVHNPDGGPMSQGNRASAGLKRCTTCTEGAAFSADVKYGILSCTSDATNDAGVTVAVLCGM